MMKTEIPRFNLRDFNENQLYDLCTKTVSMVDGWVAEDVLAEQKTDLAALNQELGLKIGRIDSNPNTEGRKEADRRRDHLKVRLFESTELALHDPESETIRNAAAVVQEVLLRRKTGFQDLSYAENTSELVTLLKDLDDPAVQQAITDAELTKWVSALKAAQDDFDKADDAFREFQRKNPEPRSLKDLRREINEVLRLILGNLVYRASRRGGPAMEQFLGIRGELVSLRSTEKLRDTVRGEASTAEPALDS